MGKNKQTEARENHIKYLILQEELNTKQVPPSWSVIFQLAELDRLRAVWVERLRNQEKASKKGVVRRKM